MTQLLLCYRIYIFSSESCNLHSYGTSDMRQSIKVLENVYVLYT